MLTMRNGLKPQASFFSVAKNVQRKFANKEKNTMIIHVYKGCKLAVSRPGNVGMFKENFDLLHKCYIS